MSWTNASKEHCVLAWLISEVLWHGGTPYGPTRTATGWGIWLHHLQRKWHQRHYCLWATETTPRSSSGSCDCSGTTPSQLPSFIACVSLSLISLLFLVFQSSVGSSSLTYGHQGGYSPYRSMMPPYNPLAASSLLNQQYAAALSLGEEMIRTLFMSERSCAFLYNVRRRSCFSTKWVLCDQYYRVCRQTPEEKSMTKTTLIIFLYLSLL